MEHMLVEFCFTTVFKKNWTWSAPVARCLIQQSCLKKKVQVKNPCGKVASCLLAPTSRNQLTLSTEGKLAKIMANFLLKGNVSTCWKRPSKKWNQKREKKGKNSETNRNLARQFHEFSPNCFPSHTLPRSSSRASAGKDLSWPRIRP